MSPGGGRDGLTILTGFVLGGWHVADGAAEPTVIEPVDPLEGGQFEVLEPTPWASAVHEFGLVEPVHRLRQCVVVESPRLPVNSVRKVIQISVRMVIHSGATIPADVLGAESFMDQSGLCSVPRPVGLAARGEDLGVVPEAVEQRRCGCASA